MRHLLTALAAPLLAALFLVGCGGPPRANALLTEARDAFAGAAEDPTIAANAPVALQEAEEAVEQAITVWQEKEDTETVNHYAYVARQRVRIAREVAATRAAEKEVETVRNERQQVVLEARAAEAEAARAVAERERQEAEAARLVAEAALTRAQELADQVDELEAELTRRGLVLTLGDVLFDSGQSTLKPGAERTIGALVTFLTENPGRRVLIEGFTDNVGSDAFNLDLSQRRADAVQQALRARGISPTRIATRGYGEQYPVASNAAPAGRQQNRRVEIVISDPEGDIPAREQ